MVIYIVLSTYMYVQLYLQFIVIVAYMYNVYIVYIVYTVYCIAYSCILYNLLSEYFLEYVLESAVVALKDCVLRAHVKRPLLQYSVLEAAVSKVLDSLCNGK